MLDLLLRHYRGVYDRIYLYSKSTTIDRGWDPLKAYVEKELGVDQREEKTFFDEFDSEALQEQMDLQMQVAEYAKKSRNEADAPSALDIRRPHGRRARYAQQPQSHSHFGHPIEAFRG